jgi:hypothetical protein
MGFKNYIKMKESFRFKNHIEANEFYIYDVLPYAYAFGLSKEWTDKFSNLSSPLPTWFNNQNNENNITSSPSDG